jgi:hypothetical protein
MKNIKLFLMVLACVVTASAYSQFSRVGLSIGADLGIPAGALNTTQKIGVGGTAKLAFPVAHDLDITLTSGLINFSGDEVNTGNGMIKRPSLNFIPVKLGTRFRVAPGSFYIEPQLGYTAISTPNSNTSATGGFTYAANAGFFLGSSFDISGRYEAVSLKNNAGNYPFLGARLAYNFKL